MKKILCGKMYDGIKPILHKNIEILIDHKHIVEVGYNLRCPDDTEIIDLSHLTVTPGLIDSHIHPQFFHFNDVYVDSIYNSEGYRTLATYHTALRCLKAGFTSIRSVGWFSESNELDVKRVINEGYLEGARMVVAAHLLGTTGSHADISQVVRTNPRMSDYMESQYTGIGNGPDFFVSSVRREKKLGSDFIKIMATGGFATPNDSPEDIQMSDDELAAIFKTAKEVNIPVTAHAYSPNLMQKLIGYGITGIEHGSLMDEETAKMFEDTGTYLVPTFTPYQEVFDNDEEGLKKKSLEFQKKLCIYRNDLQRGREVILKSDIKLGYGTDMVSVHNNYESGWEYYSMMRSGMDPFRILQAATKNNAEICGIDKFTGTIEAGKYADISAWKRDLITDPHALRDCTFVMKEGISYIPESHINTERELARI